MDGETLMTLIYIFEILDHGILLTSKVSSLVEKRMENGRKNLTTKSLQQKIVTGGD